MGSSSSIESEPEPESESSEPIWSVGRYDVWVGKRRAARRSCMRLHRGEREDIPLSSGGIALYVGSSGS
jgi:hypothetical protein